MSVLLPGETMKIICKFSNASSRTATPKVTLQYKQTYYTHNKVSKRIVCKTLVSVIGQPVSAQTSDVHTGFTLTIPPTETLTITNCSIVDVEYLIEVSTNDRLLL